MKGISMRKQKDKTPTKRKVMKNLPKSLLLGILLLGSGAFLSAVAQEETSTVKKPKEKEGNFIRGASVWANNCGRCHNFRAAKELRDDQWKVAISHMRVRAGLTGQESRDVLKFLQKSN